MTETDVVITTVVFGLFSFSSSAVDAEQIHSAETDADAVNMSCYKMCKCHVLCTHVKKGCLPASLFVRLFCALFFLFRFFLLSLLLLLSSFDTFFIYFIDSFAINHYFSHIGSLFCFAILYAVA